MEDLMNLHRPDLSTLRRKIRDNYLSDEAAVVRQAVETAKLSSDDCSVISGQAQQLVDQVRKSSHPHFTEQFLTDFGLSTDEGLALMCLAEALLRVPDAETVDLLIADKISTRDWDRLSGTSDSAVVNASTWALALTGKLLKAIPIPMTCWAKRHAPTRMRGATWMPTATRSGPSPPPPRARTCAAIRAFPSSCRHYIRVMKRPRNRRCCRR